MTMMNHKGYIGIVQFDPDAGLLHGEVINIRDVVTFQGQSVDAIKQAFVDSVEDYLAFCTERGESPEKPYSGEFRLRITPTLHKELTVIAKQKGISLNSLIESYLEQVAQQERKHA